MISLRAYQVLEDAWEGGVADWCRAASGIVLGGEQAWMVTTSDGQANWIKRRLLCEGISLFGVQFLDARALRRELCLRHGIAPPNVGKNALELLLRLHALTHQGTAPELAPVARHPGACLAALDEFAAAGWCEDGPELFAEMLPAALRDWLPVLRASGSWIPHLDRELRARGSEAHQTARPPLSLCVFGCDASFWPVFDLLAAAAKEARSAGLFAPLPRGTSEAIQQHWLTALEEAFDTSFDPCESSGFESALSGLAARLEGTELGAATDAPPPAAPELLAGHDAGDMAILARDYVTRWLVAQPAARAGRGAADRGQRLVVLCPARDVSSVAVVRALADAGIAVEDEVGEQPEPSLSIRIQRAIIAYQQDDADIQTLFPLIELLNEHAAAGGDADPRLLRDVFPLDPVEIRQALHGAFADLQHHSARILCEAEGFARAAVARPLRELIAHLGTWPETLPWREILRQWERCLDGFGLTTEVLEPLWSQLTELPIEDPVPPGAFFQFLTGILAGVPPRRATEGMNRFARVVVTSLEGATGQSWGGALFLDSNEGAWPLYPAENPFLDDAARTRLNLRRAASIENGASAASRGYLLTASDRAQLEHFRFLEILDNCTGPLAFAGIARDPAEPASELYANEWALRCLVESGRAAAEGERLLDRWRQAIRRTARPPARLPVRETQHLREVFADRRDAGKPFDEYLLNFAALTTLDELPWNDAWSARDLETAWNRPATFAFKQIFDAEPWRETGSDLNRHESWVVGRLVHRWLRVALNASREPRRMAASDWQHALTVGLPQARLATQSAMLGTAPTAGAGGALPIWWQSALDRAEWAARRCLDALAKTATEPDADGQPWAERWLSLEKTLRADVKTSHGALRLQARCDVLLLDRPTMEGAASHLIDIRTGGAPAAGPPTASQIESGQGLGLGALLYLALAEGAETTHAKAGVIHPDLANVAQWTAESVPAFQPSFERLAALQRSLVFGQKGALTGGHGRDGAENLPLATTPVDVVVLAAKARLSA